MGDLKQIESEESQSKIREAMKKLFSKKPSDRKKGADFFRDDDNVIALPKINKSNTPE